MVQLTGGVRRAFIEDGKDVTIFRIPAFSKTGARRRAKTNSRIKGIENFSLGEAERVGSGDLPGQGIYDVTVTSPR